MVLNRNLYQSTFFEKGESLSLGGKHRQHINSKSLPVVEFQRDSIAAGQPMHVDALEMQSLGKQ
jgi:hypothetical protein